jgi:hypothetical protein
MHRPLFRRALRPTWRAWLTTAAVLAFVSTPTTGGGAAANGVPPGQAPPTLTSAPSVSGTPTAGQTLTSASGDWSGKALTFTYQWQRCDSSGSSCGDAAGATGTSYALASGDVGDTIRVVVTASNKNGSASASSTPTSVVAPAPSPAPQPPPPTTTTTTTTTTSTTTTPTTTSTTPTTTTTSGSTSTPANFTFDPTASGNLLPFENLGYGGDLFASTATYPNGLTSPSIVRVVNDPLRSGRNALEETTTPAGNSPSAPSLTSTALYAGAKPYFGMPGTDNWIHFELMIPSPGWQSGGTGNWGFNPILYETHDDDYKSYWAGQGYDMNRELAEMDFSITTAAVPPNNTTTPQLSCRVLGGKAWDSTAYNQSWYYGGAVQFNHWYDILIYVHWASDNTGVFRLWVDGNEITTRYQYNYSGNGPTVVANNPNQPTLWQRPGIAPGASSAYDHPNFEINNYHPATSGNSTVYYGEMKIGTTQGSTAF